MDKIYDDIGEGQSLYTLDAITEVNEYEIVEAGYWAVNFKQMSAQVCLQNFFLGAKGKRLVLDNVQVLTTVQGS